MQRERERERERRVAGRGCDSLRRDESARRVGGAPWKEQRVARRCEMKPSKQRAWRAAGRGADGGIKLGQKGGGGGKANGSGSLVGCVG